MKLKKTITIDEELYNLILKEFKSENFSNCIEKICKKYFINNIEIENKKDKIQNNNGNELNTKLLNELLLNQNITLDILNSLALEKEGVTYYGHREENKSEAYSQSLIDIKKNVIDKSKKSNVEKILNGVV